MKKLKRFRVLSQLLVVGIISFIGIRHQVLGGGPSGSAPLDSYCPFGGIETAFAYLKNGQFLTKTNVSNFVLVTAVLFMALIAGSAFCSWMCPFGAVQEWLALLGKKIFGRNFSFSGKVHNILRYLRFITLFMILYLTAQGSKLVFEEYDPFKVLFHFNFETSTALIIFLLTIVISVVVENFWCKYLCPLGAVFSVVGRFNLINLRRNSDTCIDCGLCTKKCPMNIEVAKLDKVPAADCTKCLKCIDSCPRPDALHLTIGGAPNEN